MSKTTLLSLLAILSIFSVESAFADIDLKANLNGDAEAPPVRSVASGIADFTINDEESLITFNLNLTDIDNPIAAHIHLGAFDSSGPIILNIFLGEFGDNLSGELVFGNLVAQPDKGINTFADAINAIKAGNTYVNVHTEQNPNGEIRGQLNVVP